MVARKSNKLPEGVGKRIIEKLKNQEYEANSDEAAVSEPQEENVGAVEYPVEEDDQEVSEVETRVEIAAEEETQEKDEQEPGEEEDFEISYSCSPKVVKKKSVIYEEPGIYEEDKQQASGVSDIDTLLNLITQLPSGVTKQTGALIIRQTMEALGIPMNKVLADAQSVQEELEHSTRNNVNIIEEYRTKIKILEQEIQKFRKKAHELEDIISLFILSDEKK